MTDPKTRALSLLARLAECDPASPNWDNQADALRAAIQAIGASEKLSSQLAAVRQEAERQLRIKPSGLGHHAQGRHAAARAILECVGSTTALRANEWQSLSEAPINKNVRLLIETRNGRAVISAQFDGSNWREPGVDGCIDEKPLAWKPADSTELPGEKP